MSMDIGVFTMLAEPIIKETFQKILKFRILSYYQLESSTIDTAKLKSALQALQNKGLIEKKGAGFSDLDKYFPTREGLEVEKLIAQ